MSHPCCQGWSRPALLAWLSIVLAEYAGTKLMGFDKSPVSPVMLSILLGLIISALVPMPAVLVPGLDFVVKKVLRLGIILLGIRLTIFDVFRLGALGVPIVLICVTGALLLTTWLNRRLRLPDRLGALIAVGTSICGVSAIVATGPAIDAEDKEIAYAVAVITIFGLAATLLYPYLAHAVFGQCGASRSVSGHIDPRYVPGRRCGQGICGRVFGPGGSGYCHRHQAGPQCVHGRRNPHHGFLLQPQISA